MHPLPQAGKRLCTENNIKQTKLYLGTKLYR